MSSSRRRGLGTSMAGAQKPHKASILRSAPRLLETADLLSCPVTSSHPGKANPSGQLGAGWEVNERRRGSALGSAFLTVGDESVSAGLPVHLRMCLFSLYDTGCLQPSCVVCPQLHLLLNLVGSLPWAGALPCSTPHNLQHTHAHARTQTLLISLSRCQVCSVCLGVE